MAQLVFVLCTVTSLACCILLARAYARTRTRLLLWSAVCFGGLTVNNALVFVDLVVIPEVSLLPIRSLSSLAALLVLIAGLVLDTRGAR